MYDETAENRKKYQRKLTREKLEKFLPRIDYLTGIYEELFREGKDIIKTFPDNSTAHNRVLQLQATKSKVLELIARLPEMQGTMDVKIARVKIEWVPKTPLVKFSLGTEEEALEAMGIFV